MRLILVPKSLPQPPEPAELPDLAELDDEDEGDFENSDSANGGGGKTQPEFDGGGGDGGADDNDTDEGCDICVNIKLFRAGAEESTRNYKIIAYSLEGWTASDAKTTVQKADIQNFLTATFTEIFASPAIFAGAVLRADVACFENTATIKGVDLTSMWEGSTKELTIPCLRKLDEGQSLESAINAVRDQVNKEIYHIVRVLSIKKQFTPQT